MTSPSRLGSAEIIIVYLLLYSPGLWRLGGTERKPMPPGLYSLFLGYSSEFLRFPAVSLARWALFSVRSPMPKERPVFSEARARSVPINWNKLWQFRKYKQYFAWRRRRSKRR